LCSDPKEIATVSPTRRHRPKPSVGEWLPRVLERKIVHVPSWQSIRIRIKTLMNSRVKLCEWSAVALAKKTS
jgi:hypothetical protein